MGRVEIDLFIDYNDDGRIAYAISAQVIVITACPGKFKTKIIIFVTSLNENIIFNATVNTNNEFILCSDLISTYVLYYSMRNAR